jgi:hydrogenase maturation protease
MSILLIGMGNTFRGDDGAGLVFARRLLSRFNAEKYTDLEFEIRESDGSAFSLIELWRGWERVMVVDALIDASRPPGQILSINGLRDDFPWDPLSVSTHAFGLIEAIKLSRVLGMLPKELQVLAIVAESFAMGDGLSPSVDQAIDMAVYQWPKPVFHTFQR